MECDFDFDSFEAAVLDIVEDSPVPDLLADSTLLPSPFQSRLISTHLQTLSTSLVHLENIIKRSLILKDRLQRAHSIHNGLNSRMRTLPMELLSEVFSLVHTSIDQSSRSSHRKMLAALPLSHVCRQWRSAALSCAKLWSIIGVQAPTGSATKRNRLRGDLEWIRECVARSKGYPLSLELEYAGSGPSDFPPRTQAGFNLIVAERHRWRTLCLFVEDGANLPPFVFMENPGPLPLLESVAVFGPSRLPLGDTSYPFFHEATCLKTVEFVFAPSPLVVPPSWETLQVFNSTNTISLLKALTVCPNLLVAKREVEDPRLLLTPAEILGAFMPPENGDNDNNTNDQQQQQQVIIAHPNLRKFRLLFGNCRNEILSLLSLPALEVLDLQDYERHDHDLLRILPTFLNTSSRLRSLSLEIHLDVDDLPLFTDILCNSLPSLEVLKLKEDNPPLSLITADRPFSLISCLLASSESTGDGHADAANGTTGKRRSPPVPNLRALKYHMAIDDWAEYDTAQGETAIFCMICLAALEKVTEEVVASRFEMAEADEKAEAKAKANGGDMGDDQEHLEGLAKRPSKMKRLQALDVCVDKVEGLERDVPFFHELDKFVLKGLQLSVMMRVPGSPGDPLFDDDADDNFVNLEYH